MEDVETGDLLGGPSVLSQESLVAAGCGRFEADEEEEAV